jgi:hypothetical protein
VVDSASELSESSTFNDSDNSNSKSSNQSDVSSAISDAVSSDNETDWKPFVLLVAFVLCFGAAGAMSYAIYLKKGSDKRRWGI